jgi:hypothetical protein
MYLPGVDPCILFEAASKCYYPTWSISEEILIHMMISLQASLGLNRQAINFHSGICGLKQNRIHWIKGNFGLNIQLAEFGFLLGLGRDF